MHSHTQSWHVADLITQPLPLISSLSLQVYLQRYDLTIRDVAYAAHVRLLVVWNALHNNPISHEDADMLRMTLFSLTGVRYHGPIQARPPLTTQADASTRYIFSPPAVYAVPYAKNVHVSRKFFLGE